MPASSALVVIVIAAALISAHAVFASDVTMNLAFTINGKAADTIYVDGTSYPATSAGSTFATDFISAEFGNRVLGMVFAGGALDSVSFDTSGTDYTLSMTQAARGSKFLIGLTNGTHTDVESASVAARAFGMISKTIGSVATLQPASFPLFMRLETPYYLNALSFGGTVKLVMKNMGKSSGVTNITVSAG